MGNPTTTSIDLSGNVMNPAAAAMLGKVLASNHVLETLVLNNCELGNAAVIALCNGLSMNRSLKNLSLESNNISDAGALALSKALSVNQTLQSLNLDNNKISPAGGSIFASLFVKTQMGGGMPQGPSSWARHAASLL